MSIDLIFLCCQELYMLVVSLTNLIHQIQIFSIQLPFISPLFFGGGGQDAGLSGKTGRKMVP